MRIYNCIEMGRFNISASGIRSGINTCTRLLRFGLVESTCRVHMGCRRIPPGQFPRTIPPDNYPPGQFPLPFWVGHSPGQFPPNMLCIHTYTCMHTNTHTHTYIHTHVHIHTYTYIHIHAYIYMHTYTYIHIQAYIHIHLYVCMYASILCMYVCMYTYMYNYAKICQYI